MGLLEKIRKFLLRPVDLRYVLVSYVAIFFALAYFQYTNTEERRTSLDQFCLVQEQRHMDQITNLRRTYQYLDQLTAAQRLESFNGAIIRLLPETEQEAKTDVAPPICDTKRKTGVLGVLLNIGTEKDYGNPEPDPVVPERPPSLQGL